MDTPPTTIICHHCHQDIPPRGIEVKRGAARVLAFECPKCGYRHAFALLTARGVHFRAQLERLRERLREHDPRSNPQVTLRRIESLQRLVRRATRRLDHVTDHPLTRGEVVEPDAHPLHRA